MWPLLACSVIALAIVIERIFFLRKNRVIPRELIEEVERLAGMGRLNDIEQLLKKSSSPLRTVIMAAIKNAGMHREIIKDYMEEAGAAEAYNIERFIEILGIIAVISPLLGFLGTVTGILTSFQAMSTYGVRADQLFASGVSQALITTVAGLSISVPVYICYRLLIARSDFIVLEMEKTSSRILEYLKGEAHEVQKEIQE